MVSRALGSLLFKGMYPAVAESEEIIGGLAFYTQVVLLACMDLSVHPTRHVRSHGL